MCVFYRWDKKYTKFSYVFTIDISDNEFKELFKKITRAQYICFSEVTGITTQGWQYFSDTLTSLKSGELELDNLQLHKMDISDEMFKYIVSIRSNTC